MIGLHTSIHPYCPNHPQHTSAEDPEEETGRSLALRITIFSSSAPLECTPPNWQLQVIKQPDAMVGFWVTFKQPCKDHGGDIYNDCHWPGKPGMSRASRCVVNEQVSRTPTLQATYARAIYGALV